MDKSYWLFVEPGGFWVRVTSGLGFCQKKKTKKKSIITAALYTEIALSKM